MNVVALILPHLLFASQGRILREGNDPETLANNEARFIENKLADGASLEEIAGWLVDDNEEPLGQTNRGKDVYAGWKPTDYPDFDAQDHRDAAIVLTHKAGACESSRYPHRHLQAAELEHQSDAHTLYAVTLAAPAAYTNTTPLPNEETRAGALAYYHGRSTSDNEFTDDQREVAKEEIRISFGFEWSPTLEAMFDLGLSDAECNQ